MTVEEIGSIIHTERIRKGLSCRELAELSNTSAATVCRLETGKRKGSTKAALKILKALDIKLEITEEKTAESIVDPISLYSKIEFAIESSNGTDEYMVGFRNGLRYALYLLDVNRTREFQAEGRGHRMSIQPVDDAACLTEEDKKRLLQEFAVYEEENREF